MSATESPVGNLTTDEIIEQAKLAINYAEDGARETALKILRDVVTRASSYFPIVHLETGHESHAIGSALVDGYVRLQPTDRPGYFEAPDGSLWVDGVWRQA